MGICFNQIRLLQNFALLLQFFALLLQIFALLLHIFALLFGINCTEIDQSQSSIIYVYIIIGNTLKISPIIKGSLLYKNVKKRKIWDCPSSYKLTQNFVLTLFTSCRRSTTRSVLVSYWIVRNPDDEWRVRFVKVPYWNHLARFFLASA